MPARAREGIYALVLGQVLEFVSVGRSSEDPISEIEFSFGGGWLCSLSCALKVLGVIFGFEQSLGGEGGVNIPLRGDLGIKHSSHAAGGQLSYSSSSRVPLILSSNSQRFSTLPNWVKLILF